MCPCDQKGQLYKNIRMCPKEGNKMVKRLQGMTDEKWLKRQFVQLREEETSLLSKTSS